MADRVDFFFRQRVTEAELDLAFELLEQADRDLAADIGVYGIVTGAIPTQHSPVPDLSVDLTSPTRAYDRLGQRIFVGTDQTVDCSVDLVGIPTGVSAPVNERWLALFLRFDRQLSEPRTDGNGQQVYFRRDESFEVVVRQAAEGPIGGATRVALQQDELLVCEVRLVHGQTAILDTDLDLGRRQAFIFAQGTSVAVTTGAWDVLSPVAGTVQASLDEVDAELQGHFGGTARRHAASAIDYAPHAFVGEATVQAALDALIDALSSSAAGGSGASRVGSDAAAGAPNALAAGSVKSQLVALLGFINAHVGAAVGAHLASAIAASAHHHIAATNVQGQLNEIVADLLSTSGAQPGAGLVGVDAIAGAPTSIAAGTLRAALGTLLDGLNAHVTRASGAHAASAISVADAGNNLNAGNVEAALAEILDAFEDDHFRGNESNAGQHRAIRQPIFAGSRVLLWDARGSGGSAGRFRVYSDATSIWMTLNAAWNGASWVRDTTALPAGGLRLSRNEFELLHFNLSGSSFTAWARTWRLPMSSSVNSGFETTGAIRETGRIGETITNTHDARRTLAIGGSTTFRSRFQATPSSITLTALSTPVGYPSTPFIVAADRDGFSWLDFPSVAASGSVFWYGRYTAIA